MGVNLSGSRTCSSIMLFETEFFFLEDVTMWKYVSITRDRPTGGASSVRRRRETVSNSSCGKFTEPHSSAKVPGTAAPSALAIERHTVKMLKAKDMLDRKLFEYNAD